VGRWERVIESFGGEMGEGHRELWLERWERGIESFGGEMGEWHGEFWLGDGRGG
jgi:hypothetical protein